MAHSCNEAIPYNNSANVLAEFLCPRLIQRSSDLSVPHPESEGSYPRRYFAICAKITESLANPYIDRGPLKARFSSFQRELDDMIKRPQFHDNGDFIFHIDARMIDAGLPAFYHRAEYGHDEPVPHRLIQDNLHRNALILQDFDGLYKNRAHQVGNKRTEIEILALTNYIALSDSRFFAYPALFHEDSSRTRAHNHDLNIPCYDEKVSIQVKTADYFDRDERDGRLISRRYADNPHTLVVIHNDIVNLEPPKRSIFRRNKQDSDDDPYAHHDPDNNGRYINWGAFQTEISGDLTDEARDAYQRMTPNDRKALLTRTLIKVGQGKRLNRLESEFLNDRALHLKKAIKQKMPR